MDNQAEDWFNEFINHPPSPSSSGSQSIDKISEAKIQSYTPATSVFTGGTTPSQPQQLAHEDRVPLPIFRPNCKTVPAQSENDHLGNASERRSPRPPRDSLSNVSGQHPLSDGVFVVGADPHDGRYKAGSSRRTQGQLVQPTVSLEELSQIPLEPHIRDEDIQGGSERQRINKDFEALGFIQRNILFDIWAATDNIGREPRNDRYDQFYATLHGASDGREHRTAPGSISTASIAQPPVYPVLLGYINYDGFYLERLTRAFFLLNDANCSGIHATLQSLNARINLDLSTNHGATVSPSTFNLDPYAKTQNTMHSAGQGDANGLHESLPPGRFHQQSSRKMKGRTNSLSDSSFKLPSPCNDINHDAKVADVSNGGLETGESSTRYHPHYEHHRQSNGKAPVYNTGLPQDVQSSAPVDEVNDVGTDIGRIRKRDTTSSDDSDRSNLIGKAAQKGRASRYHKIIKVEVENESQEGDRSFTKRVGKRSTKSGQRSTLRYWCFVPTLTGKPCSFETDGQDRFLEHVIGSKHNAMIKTKCSNIFCVSDDSWHTRPNYMSEKHWKKDRAHEEDRQDTVKWKQLWAAFKMDQASARLLMWEEMKQRRGHEFILKHDADMQDIIKEQANAPSEAYPQDDDLYTNVASSSRS